MNRSADSIPPMALLTAARELQELSPNGEYVSYRQTPWAEIYPEETMPVNLDGEPVHLYVADGALRAVAVPAGEHLVDLRFESATLDVGMAISLNELFDGMGVPAMPAMPPGQQPPPQQVPPGK